MRFEQAAAWLANALRVVVSVFVVLFPLAPIALDAKSLGFGYWLSAVSMMILQFPTVVCRGITKSFLFGVEQMKKVSLDC